MGFKRNVVKADLCSYPSYMFLAQKKFGKTTFWWNLVREAWGSDEKGLLISFGNEEGYHSLDGLNYEVAKDWNSTYDEETDLRGFVQIVDDIVDNNDEYGLKGVCFDTLDTMVAVCTKEVLRQHKREKGTPCKTLNEAFSGYGRGRTRLLDLMDEQIARLRDAGLAVFFLAHIKLKEKSDLVSGEKYEQITNNLADDIYSHFADAAQIVMVGAIDREINAGKIIGEKRVIYLRGNSLIDAGGRFTHIADKIDLSPRAFLDAFNDAVKSSIVYGNNDNESIKNREEEENKKRQEIAKRAKVLDEKNRVNAERNDELISIIKPKFLKTTAENKEAVKDVMSEYGFEKFTDPDIPTVALEKIVQILS